MYYSTHKFTHDVRICTCIHLIHCWHSPLISIKARTRVMNRIFVFILKPKEWFKIIYLKRCFHKYLYCRIKIESGWYRVATYTATLNLGVWSIIFFFLISFNSSICMIFSKTLPSVQEERSLSFDCGTVLSPSSLSFLP